MPYVEPNTIEDVSKRDRTRLLPLLRERAFLQCSLSLDKLLKAGIAAYRAKRAITADDVREAVVASGDSELKKVIKPLNDAIGGILQENGITSLKDTDAFGNPKVYSYYESGGATLSKDRLIKALTDIAKLKPTVVEKIIEAATVKYQYVTLRVADPSRPKGEGGEE